jgi:hypothetical protein
MIREKTPHQIEMDAVEAKRFQTNHVEMVNLNGDRVYIRKEDVKAQETKGFKHYAAASKPHVDAGWPKSSDE